MNPKAWYKKIQRSGGPHIDQGAVFMSSYAEKLLTAGVVAANTVGREQCLKFAAMNWWMVIYTWHIPESPAIMHLHIRENNVFLYPCIQRYSSAFYQWNSQVWKPKPNKRSVLHWKKQEADSYIITDDFYEFLSENTCIFSPMSYNWKENKWKENWNN